MTNIQRTLLAIYVPITVLIIIFDNLYPQDDMVVYIKFASIFMLFVSSLLIQKKYREQRIMATAFIFILFSDFFLVFIKTLHGLNVNLSPLGILGFMCAYLCLTFAYQKNVKLGKKEVVCAIPFVLIFAYVFITLRSNVKFPMQIGTLIFGMVLIYMAWTAVCTTFRGYYNVKISRLIALSGSLMFISDMGVAFSMFHPYYSTVYVPWLQNIIWGGYIPAWIILLLIISEENIHMKEKPIEN